MVAKSPVVMVAKSPVVMVIRLLLLLLARARAGPGRMDIFQDQ